MDMQAAAKLMPTEADEPVNFAARRQQLAGVPVSSRAVEGIGAPAANIMFGSSWV